MTMKGYCFLFKGVLSALIHILIILLVVPRSDVVHPFLVIQIPADGLLDAFFELQAGLPTQFLLELGRVDGIAQVVSGAVGDVGDEVEILALGTTEETVNRVDEHLDEVDVLPLVEATDVIGLGNLALMEK